jgi:hypothetical protein
MKNSGIIGISAVVVVLAGCILWKMSGNNNTDENRPLPYPGSISIDSSTTVGGSRRKRQGRCQKKNKKSKKH